jgi:hypothetical protein
MLLEHRAVQDFSSAGLSQCRRDVTGAVIHLADGATRRGSSSVSSRRLSGGVLYTREADRQRGCRGGASLRERCTSRARWRMPFRSKLSHLRPLSRLIFAATASLALRHTPLALPSCSRVNPAAAALGADQLFTSPISLRMPPISLLSRAMNSANPAASAQIGSKPRLIMKS